jgi:hypothetical protein
MVFVHGVMLGFLGSNYGEVEDGEDSRDYADFLDKNASWNEVSFLVLIWANKKMFFGLKMDN